MRTKKAPTEESPSPVVRVPRTRKRNGKHRTHKPNEDRRGVITLCEDAPSMYSEPNFSGFAPRVRGAKIRNSKRWIRGTSGPYSALNFPYIDKLGRFTGTTLFKWSCDPRSYIASLVATITDRLKNRALYYNDMRLVVKNSDRLVRAAYYYAVSKNAYFWDRILFFVKNLKENGNLISRFVLRWNLRTDAHKRFVYGHVCNQTKWLLFRAERPRDKSAVERRTLTLLPDGRSGRDLLWVGGILGDMACAMSTFMS